MDIILCIKWKVICLYTSSVVSLLSAFELSKLDKGVWISEDALYSA